MDPKATQASAILERELAEGGEEESLVPLLPEEVEPEVVPELEAVATPVQMSTSAVVEDVAIDEPPTQERVSPNFRERVDAVRSFVAANFNCVAAGVLAGILILAYITGGGGPNCAGASGPLVRRELTISPFDKVKIDLPTKVLITQADKLYVEVESNAYILDHFNTKVYDGEWDITLDVCVHKVHKLNVYIETPVLDSIVSVGSGEVEVLFDHDKQGTPKKDKTIGLHGSGDMKAFFSNLDVLNTHLLGSGNLVLQGDGQIHHIKSLGSGDVDAFHFLTQNTTIGMIGSGDAKVNANQSLVVNMIGSGDVRYMGNPQVKKSGFGSGGVKRVGSSLADKSFPSRGSDESKSME